MKNDNHLEAAALTEVQPKNLKSLKHSVSAHIDRCFGYFFLEQKSFLWIVSMYKIKKISAVWCLMMDFLVIFYYCYGRVVGKSRVSCRGWGTVFELRNSKETTVNTFFENETLWPISFSELKKFLRKILFFPCFLASPVLWTLNGLWDRTEVNYVPPPPD